VQQWGNLSDGAREQFYWTAPGQPVDIPTTQVVPAPPTGGRGADGKVLSVPDTFLLVLLWPLQVKYLRLTDNFSQLDRLVQTDGLSSWVATRVTP
jgi:hypothetical protein